MDPFVDRSVCSFGSICVQFCIGLYAFLLHLPPKAFVLTGKDGRHADLQPVRDRDVAHQICEACLEQDDALGTDAVQ